MTSPLVMRPEYLNQIGRIDAEWSTIEHVMVALFQFFMGVDAARAHAAFSELPSHRTRRDVLFRVAEIALAGRPELKQFREIDRQMTRAARARNQIAHATWGLLDGAVVVLDPRNNWSPTPISLAQLKETEQAISTVYADCIAFLRVLRQTAAAPPPETGPLPPAAVAAPGKEKK
jgi:hypothetical protein